MRNEVARRWKALVALGVLAGLVGGLALAAVAGARLTSTAYERFREATGRADAIVFATLIGVLDADYYLRNVRTLPKALAGLLVLLGLGAMGHVLATTVRRRRHDLAVLRALGFRALQVGGCVAWQAVTVSVVALLVGIPLGIAVGRWSWRWVADSTPLLYVPPIAAVVVLVSIPAALVLAITMAALPARRAAHLRPADVLRAE